MKILCVTNMWPIPQHPYYGIFVKEQIEGIKKNYPETEFEIYFINGKSSKLNYFLSVFKINWKLLFNTYDVIHIHFGLSGFFVIFNPFIKIPIITTLHSADIDLVKSNRFFVWVSKQVIKRSKTVFYLNDKMLSILFKYRDKLIYLPCGVNTDDFYPEMIKKKITEKILIGFPANKARPEKNYELFDQIIEKIKLKIPSSTIEIIEFHNKTRQEVRQSLNAIDLLIMTSVSEGSPQIIKEALSCNTPIVSTNVGDVKRLIENVSSCALVDSFDAENFVEPVLKILSQSNIGQVSNGREQIFKLQLDEKSVSEKIYEQYTRSGK
jgi:teichuronic acid biosynthesis glycosyltransferase TuaC